MFTYNLAKYLNPIISLICLAIIFLFFACKKESYQQKTNNQQEAVSDVNHKENNNLQDVIIDPELSLNLLPLIKIIPSNIKKYKFQRRIVGFNDKGLFVFDYNGQVVGKKKLKHIINIININDFYDPHFIAIIFNNGKLFFTKIYLEHIGTNEFGTNEFGTNESNTSNTSNNIMPISWQLTPLMEIKNKGNWQERKILCVNYKQSKYEIFYYDKSMLTLKSFTIPLLNNLMANASTNTNTNTNASANSNAVKNNLPDKKYLDKTNNESLLWESLLTKKIEHLTSKTLNDNFSNNEIITAPNKTQFCQIKELQRTKEQLRKSTPQIIYNIIYNDYKYSFSPQIKNIKKYLLPLKFYFKSIQNKDRYVNNKNISINIKSNTDITSKIKTSFSSVNYGEIYRDGVLFIYHDYQDDKLQQKTKLLIVPNNFFLSRVNVN